MAAEQPAISQTLLGIRFFDAARSGESSRRCVTPKFAELFWSVMMLCNTYQTSSKRIGFCARESALLLG